MAPEQGLTKEMGKDTLPVPNANKDSQQQEKTTHIPRDTITHKGHSSSRGPSPRPGRRMRTGWIVYPNKRELTGYLRECGIDDVGTVEELRRLLVNYISGGNYNEAQLRRFQELEALHSNPGPQQTPMVETRSEEHLSRDSPDFSILDREPSTTGLAPSWPLNEPTGHEDVNRPQTMTRNPRNEITVDCRTFKCIRKWGLMYDGRTDSIDSIDRIEELAASQGIPLDQIAFALSESLSDSALAWWRNRQTEWSSWAQFKRAFLRFFLSSQYWENLEDDIRRQKQGYNEPGKTYILELESLMRHTNLTTEQRLDRIYKNSSPLYQMLIQRREFATLDEFTDLVTHIEARGVAHIEPRGAAASQLQVLAIMGAPQSNPAPRRKNPFAAQPKLSGDRIQNPKEACRRCAQHGHQVRDCRGRQILFCWECGQRNIRTNECCKTQSKASNPTNATTARGVRGQRPTTTKAPIVVGPPKTDGQSITVNLTVDDRNWQGTIDTGSINSFISTQVADTIPAWYGRREPTRVIVSMANGHRQEVTEFIPLTLRLGDQQCDLPLLVLPNAMDDFLLGMDFLSGTGSRLKLETGDVTLRNYQHTEETKSRSYQTTPSDPEPVELDVPTSHTQDNPELDARERQEVEAFLHRELEEFRNLDGLSNAATHKIVMKDDRPIKQRYTPRNPAMQSIISEKVDELLEKNCIEPSNSPYSAPVVLVRKKNGKWRMCIDYRQLNAKSIPDAYPLPRIQHILDRLRNAKFISSLDLKDGYWQIPMDPDSQQYTAFTVPGRGLFQWKVMPFGLHSGPATFQRALDRVIGTDLEPHAFAYLDDIIITSATLKEHITTLGEVFRRLRAAKLRINPEKCDFFQKETKYLGHVINAQGIRTDPEKIAAIEALKPPTNVRELRRCLGIGSWYRRFVPDFAKITQPMTELLKKGKHFKWGPSQQQAFEELKRRFTEAPVLACPDFNLTFKLQTDASDYGLGAVLTQDLDGQERVIAYASRHLNRAEKNYSATEKECLAIIWGIRKMREYLEGYKFIVVTDHMALKWLNSIENPTGRIARWALELQQYNFDIQYRKGKYNVIADALSRQPLTTAQRIVEPNDNTNCLWLEKKKIEIKENPEKYPEYAIENNQLYRHFPKSRTDEDGTPWKLCVAKSDRLRVLQENHDHPTAGHMGIRRTISRITNRYYWPGMFRDISKYVRQCEQCQRFKATQQAPPGRLLTHHPEEPWATVCADFVGPLPRSKHGNTMLLVFQDKFTKWIELVPLRSATAESVIKAFRTVILARFGTPKMLITDNGKQFISKILEKALEGWGVKHQFTAPYTPQENAVERANRTIKTMLAQYAEGNQRTWDEVIPEVTLALNTGVSEATGHTAAYLVQGRELRLPAALYDEVTPGTGQAPEEPTARGDRLNETFNLVRQTLQQASQTQARHYNQGRRNWKPTIGQLVWIKERHLSNAVEGFAAKLAPKYGGPFQVTGFVSAVIIKGQSLLHGKEKTAHLRDLKEYHGPTIANTIDGTTKN